MSTRFALIAVALLAACQSLDTRHEFVPGDGPSAGDLFVHVRNGRLIVNQDPIYLSEQGATIKWQLKAADQWKFAAQDPIQFLPYAGLDAYGIRKPAVTGREWTCTRDSDTQVSCKPAGDVAPVLGAYYPYLVRVTNGAAMLVAEPGMVNN